MCHNSVLENEQIDKCVENGMPKKIVKSLKFTIKKRIAQYEKYESQQNNNNNNNNNYGDHNHNPSNDNDKHNYDKHNEKIQKNSFVECLDQMNEATIITQAIPETTTTTTTTVDGRGQLHHEKYQQKEKEQIINNNDNNGPQAGSAGSLTGLCGRFRLQNSSNIMKEFGIKGITNISRHNGYDRNNDNSNNYNKNHRTFTDDHMTKTIEYFEKCVSHIHLKFRHFKNNKIYLFLTTTTQPAHVLTIAIISFVLLAVWPELAGWKNTTSLNAIDANDNLNGNNDNNILTQTPNKLIIVIYLGSFATHFGSQIWMTFVSGLSLYFSLPRHLFGQCQQILFPKYFTLNAALSILMLILFVKYFLITWTTTKLLQVGTLAVSAIIEIVVRIYMAPNLLRLMLQKYRIEGSIGSGTEIGRLVQGDLIQCPHYQRIHGAFRRLHITVAIGNMIAMAASCIHLCYLAAQIQIKI